MSKYTGPNGKTALQQEYIDEKVAALERHLVALPGVAYADDAGPALEVEEIADELAARLQPKFDALHARLDKLELELGAVADCLYNAICYPPGDGHGPPPPDMWPRD